uniref:Ankyrin repeat domain-containing protein 54 n=1 Tax=Lygus hesperus TaxID=30085 RepID=A0A146L694_LYGHE
MASKITKPPVRRPPRYLIPKFPEHLSFSIPPELRSSTRQRPNHESIHASALAGDAIDVRLFINEGVDVNAIDSMGDAPIHYACISKHRNQPAIVKMLLDNGANPLALTITGQSVLHLLAVDSTSPSTLSTLKLLLERGVSINIEDAIGRTPLGYVLDRLRSLRSFIPSKKELLKDLTPIEYVVSFLVLNGARCGVTDMQIMMNNDRILFYIIENLILDNSDLSKSTLNAVVRKHICHSKTFIVFQIFASEAKMFYCCESFTWGPGDNCTISKWAFLCMSEISIAELATRAPLLYFSIRQPFRMYKPNYELNWKILKRHYQRQFDKFCFYFVKEQLKRINFTNGRVTLNYDCVQTLAGFLNLEDLVNLCVAFNFEDSVIENIRKLNERNTYHRNTK